MSEREFKPLDLEEKELIRKFGYDESLNLAPLASNIGLAFNDNIKGLIKEIKQRIKKACESYLKYKDKPDSLAKEHPEYRQIIVLNFNTLCLNCKKELGEVCIRTWVGWDDGDYDYFCSEKCTEEYKKHLPKTKNILVPTHEEYNEWLFKLAFKDVLEEGERK